MNVWKNNDNNNNNGNNLTTVGWSWQRETKIYIKQQSHRVHSQNEIYTTHIAIVDFIIEKYSTVCYKQMHTFCISANANICVIAKLATRE